MNFAAKPQAWGYFYGARGRILPRNVVAFSGSLPVFIQAWKTAGRRTLHDCVLVGSSFPSSDSLQNDEG